MAGRLIGAWNPALDSVGAPISGSKIYSYRPGTTTQLATYPTAADADAGTNPHANPVVADSAGRFAELWTPDDATYDLKWTDAAGAQIEVFEDIAALGAPVPGVTHRSYLAGLGLSTAGSSANMTIAGGQATDATNTQLINLAATITKTTSAWAAGTNQGALDTGAVANTTWYHWYVIENPTTGDVDVCFSLSASAPTTGVNIPATYTLYRRIGAMKTNGSAQWLGFQQYGSTFWWVTTVLDVNTTPTSGTQNAVTLSVPTGVNVEAIIRATAGYASGAGSTLKVYPTFINGGQNTASVLAGNTSTAAEVRVITNTSAQVDTTFTYGGSTVYELETLGWIDRRGRDD